MRIFTRRLNESVSIGAGITLTVVEIRGSQVRIGVTAPPNVHILRGELAGDARGPARRPDAGS
jgi:carbon storage regulator